MYYGSAEVGTNPEYNRREGIFGHHLEIRQAFCLSPPQSGHDETAQPLAVVAQEAVGATKELFDAFTRLEIAKVARAPARRGPVRKPSQPKDQGQLQSEDGRTRAG